MTGAELAARITAAKAVNDDFNREVDAWSRQDADRPDYAARAFRLSCVLGLLLAELEPGSAAEAAPGRDPGLEHDETERRWLRTRLLGALGVTEPTDGESAIADALAAMPGDVCLVVTRWLQRRQGAGPEAGKLAEVRAVLAAFDWGRDDLQYALKHIERIVTGGDR
ncbi:MAG: hypothetical protein ACLQDY_03740 [Streptosporangiaceae bacterium]